MRRIGLLSLAMVCAALAVLAPAADAHRLTKKKAVAALQPLLAEVTPTVAPVIVAKLPGATIAKSSVEACEITKKGHRAECLIVFNVKGASTGETDCAMDARVEYRSKRSKQLKFSLSPFVICAFPIPLE